MTSCQWDLGEFEQKGSIATRWGTKEQLLHAVEVAKAHGIDVLIDAVLNVCASFIGTFRRTHIQPYSTSLVLTRPRHLWLYLWTHRIVSET